MFNLNPNFNYFFGYNYFINNYFDRIIIMNYYDRNYYYDLKKDYYSFICHWLLWKNRCKIYNGRN